MTQGNPKLPNLNQFNRDLGKDMNENAGRNSEEYKVKKEVRSKLEQNIIPNSGGNNLGKEFETNLVRNAYENNNKKLEQREIYTFLFESLFKTSA